MAISLPTISRIRFDLKTVDYLRGIKYLYFLLNFYHSHTKNTQISHYSEKSLLKFQGDPDPIQFENIYFFHFKLGLIVFP